MSASEEWMDVIEAEGLIVGESRQSFLGNSLVVIGAADAKNVDLSQDALLTALGDGRLSVALVDAAPAGRYAKAALQSLGFWEALEPRLAQSTNVRAALALVSRQETPLGIVYETDARADPKVTVVATIPAASHPDISYVIAAIQDTPAAGKALALLTDPKAREIYRKHGFTTRP
ncbi:UNVERIFIED_CONTAM: hypothetical protein GTU68_018913 [Idotea baltica]|nr:hypothetical protein [Idotea baltica]